MASRATLEEKNSTLNQRLAQDSRSLQRQISSLNDQLAFKERELAGAEETKRRLLAELEEERKRKLAAPTLPIRPAATDDDERLKTLAVSRREKRSSTSGSSREAEERTKSQSTGLASLVRMVRSFTALRTHSV
jgi:chromosome segregation ATPase